MLKVILIGYGKMFANLLLGIEESGHKVVGAFRYESVRLTPFLSFFKNIFAPDPDLSFIKSKGIYEIKTRSVNSKKFRKEILKLGADIIIVGSWGEKLNKESLNLARIATVNVHPSLLPKYRGANPYVHTIMNGEKQTGVSFHLIDEGFDSGPIIAQELVEIDLNDTGKSLRHKCTIKARRMVGELLNKLETDLIIPLSQDNEKSSYAPQIKEVDILISNDLSSVEIHNKIRALYSFSPCYIEYNKKFYKIKSYEINGLSDKENLQITKTDSFIFLNTRDNKTVKFSI